MSRITPAHAGSTGSVPRCSSWSPDHPRTCGEHSCAWCLCGTLLGSPPHMRGARDRADGARRLGGITPAHAGSTYWLPFRYTRRRDHPRTCGEHSRARPRRPSSTGSPPHMRGALGVDLHGGARGGITPAHAGSTRAARSERHGRRDHPRTCGEHDISAGKIDRIGGSPPHMRGAHPGYAGAGYAARITPAHAGSTSNGRESDPVDRDHPRTCGEHPESSGHDS